MPTEQGNSPFNRCGFAARSDLELQEYRHLIAHLEIDQARFLSRENMFRSPTYPWPSDALHDFSRIWEYPYVIHHILHHWPTRESDTIPVVADIGSGVTFFPFALAQKGLQVVCTDIDPVCQNDLTAAAACVPHTPGVVQFRLIQGKKLPFVQDECDFVYCISVLEHIPDFPSTLQEIHRILKPGGIFIVTCDVNLNPSDSRQLNVDEFKELHQLLEKYFKPSYGYSTIHPLDLLTTINSPFPREAPRIGIPSLIWQFMKQKLIKPLLLRPSLSVLPIRPNVTVFGGCFQKKL